MVRDNPRSAKPAAALQNRLDEIEELFDQADDDGDQQIDFLEFKSLMQDLDAEMSAQSMEIGFREIDLDRNGRIDFNEFRNWWSSN